MRHLIFAAVIAVPLPALAAEQCDHWTAAMQEDEGGSVMTASICAPVRKDKAYLSLTCGEKGKLSIRFLPAPTDGFPPRDNYKGKLDFSMDQEMFDRPAVFEEMDGAMATDVEIGAPMIDVMQHQKEVIVAETSDKGPKATFSLKGSRAAFRKLIATCKK
jgi:hypothetical protein